MFVHINTPDLVTSIRSVDSECAFKIDRVLSANLVNKVYSLRDKQQSGKDFHALFQKAVDHYHVKEDQQKWYRRVIGRYFNPRAVAAKKRKDPDKRVFPRISGNPTDMEARVEISRDVVVKFRALLPSGHLEWKDVLEPDCPPSAYQSDMHPARKKALAVMNGKR